MENKYWLKCRRSSTLTNSTIVVTTETWQFHMKNVQKLPLKETNYVARNEFLKYMFLVVHQTQHLCNYSLYSQFSYTFFDHLSVINCSLRLFYENSKQRDWL